MKSAACHDAIEIDESLFAQQADARRASVKIFLLNQQLPSNCHEKIFNESIHESHLMIELEGVTKSYPLNGQQVQVLKGITLYIARGEFVSIMGPSGSGKSTLAAILGCLSTPSQGKYLINGVDVSAIASTKLAKLRSQSIGYVFQDFNLMNGLNAWENVALPLVYAGVGRKERFQRAMDCLDAVGLTNRAKNRPYQLSGGQKQRVAIARALVNRPQFLFADEPTGALDKKTGQEILSIIQKLNETGNTVIMVTHSPTDAQHSKRIIHLVDGNIVRDEVVQKPLVQSSHSSDVSITLSENYTQKLWQIAKNLTEKNSSNLEGMEILLAHSNNRESLIEAAKAVGKWPWDLAKNMAEQLSQSKDWAVRLELLGNLQRCPEELRREYFENALKDESAWIRFVSLNNFRSVDSSTLSDLLKNQILNLVNDSDERVRATAITIVAKHRFSGFENVLVTALKDSDPRVRANAVEEMHRAKIVQQHAAHLTFMLTDRHNRVRANTILALAPFEPNLVKKSVLSMMESPDSLSRASAAWVFGKLDYPHKGAALIQWLKLEKEDLVIAQIANSLGHLSKADLNFAAEVSAAFAEKQRQVV